MEASHTAQGTERPSVLGPSPKNRGRSPLLAVAAVREGLWAGISLVPQAGARPLRCGGAACMGSWFMGSVPSEAAC